MYSPFLHSILTLGYFALTGHRDIIGDTGNGDPSTCTHGTEECRGVEIFEFFGQWTLILITPESARNQATRFFTKIK
jgi:hypothetical protein